MYFGSIPLNSGPIPAKCGGIQAYSSSIPVYFSSIPLESSGMDAFLQESVGHQKVQNEVLVVVVTNNA